METALEHVWAAQRGVYSSVTADEAPKDTPKEAEAVSPVAPPRGELTTGKKGGPKQRCGAISPPAATTEAGAYVR